MFIKLQIEPVLQALEYHTYFATIVKITLHYKYTGGTIPLRKTRRTLHARFVIYNFVKSATGGTNQYKIGRCRYTQSLLISVLKPIIDTETWVCKSKQRQLESKL